MREDLKAARGLVCVHCRDGSPHGMECLAETQPRTVAAIAAALYEWAERGRTEERAACAQVARDWTPALVGGVPRMMARDAIAAAIEGREEAR